MDIGCWIDIKLVFDAAGAFIGMWTWKHDCIYKAVKRRRRW